MCAVKLGHDIARCKEGFRSAVSLSSIGVLDLSCRIFDSSLISDQLKLGKF